MKYMVVLREAIKETSNVLAVTGKVLPMTLEDVKLCAVLENGDILKGESHIPLDAMRAGSRIDYIYTEPKISYPLRWNLWKQLIMQI